MDLVLVRHGESEANSAGIIQGRGDYGLSPRGREQSLLTAQALADLAPYRIYTSPLARALETARIINRPHNTEIVVLSDLVEYDLGEFEGLSGDDLLARYPEVPEAMKKGVPFHHLAPGAETDVEAEARAARALEEITDSGFPRVIVVSHLGILDRMIEMLVRKYSFHDTASTLDRPLKNCSITHIRLQPLMSRVVAVNGVAHLE